MTNVAHRLVNFLHKGLPFFVMAYITISMFHQHKQQVAQHSLVYRHSLQARLTSTSY